MKELKKLNPNIVIEEETEHLNLKKLWGDDTFMIRLKKGEADSTLNNLTFPSELSAVHHTTEELLEFIMQPASESYFTDFADFSFHYEGKEYKCSFTEPTPQLFKLANGFRELSESSSTDYRNLREFRDFLRKDDLPKYVQKYFENRKPVSFKIQGDFQITNADYKLFAKHFNFYVTYYNRSSPKIIIHEQKAEKEKYEVPCLTNENQFPSALTFNPIDPVLLDMFEISRETKNVRLKYLFYFQILEYCSFYYLSDDLTKKLRDIIKRPDLLNNPNEYTKLIVDQFKENFKHNDDSMKLEKTIVDYCSFEDIKIELNKNLQFFTQPLEFDGGFKLDSILNDESCIDKPPKQIMRTVKNNIERIRNTMVHLRESRENKVILPTEKNNHMIIPYLFVVRRLAEKVAIMHGN
ncbi:MAG: hypothetical protein N4A45_08335 [Flavobacteriales bacterium]|jgi:hypothetical protein|nr:hypothetical protein [Flavobacteriales bacterium]